MNRKRISAAVLAVLVSLILTICSAQTASSAAESGTVKLSYVLSGTRFELYRIGELTAHGAELCEPFDAYNVDIYDPDAAYTLAAYIARDHIGPVAAAVTDSDGEAGFDGLEEGVYLLNGESSTVGQEYYTVDPSVFALSYSEGGCVELEVKYGVVQGARRSRLSCVKIWEDEEDTHPEITASLLCDGELYETFCLSEENNWTYVWFDLDMTHEWLIAEELDDDEYTVSVSREGNTFTIVNKRDDTPPGLLTSGPKPDPTTPGSPTTGRDDPSTPDQDTPTNVPEPSSTTSVIPQTGQLNWIIFALVITGALLCLIGVLLRKKHDEKE